MNHNFKVPVDAANVSLMTAEHIKAHGGDVRWAMKKGILHFIPAKGTFKVFMNLMEYGRTQEVEMTTKVGFYIGDACYAFQKSTVWSKYLDGNDHLDDPQDGRVSVTCDDGRHCGTAFIVEAR